MAKYQKSDTFRSKQDIVNENAEIKAENIKLLEENIALRELIIDAIVKAKIKVQMDDETTKEIYRR